MALEIFMDIESNTKTGIVTEIGYDQTPNGYKPYMKDSSFPASEADIKTDSTITNLTDGTSASLVYVFSDGRIAVHGVIFQVGDKYSVTVGDLRYGDVKLNKLDTFDDETVELTQSIKDFKDVSKILTDYTKDFNLPASKKNNRLFGHYSESYVDGGFDARFRRPCLIKIDGIDWKNLELRLNKVVMKNGTPIQYNVSLIGVVSSLKLLMGDDTINQLDYLDIFNHSINFTNTRQGISRGWNVSFDSDENPVSLDEKTDYDSSFTKTPDLIYPFISSKTRYYVDSSDSQDLVDGTRNLYDSSPSTYSKFKGLYYEDLKPSIKLYHIFRGMEKKYNIKFSEDFIPRITDNSKDVNIKSPLYPLYLHCTGKSGYVSNTVRENIVSFDLSDLEITSGTDVRDDSSTTIRPYYDKDWIGRVRRIKYRYLVSVNVSGGDGGTLSMEDKETGEVYVKSEFTGSGTKHIEYIFESKGGKFEYRRPSIVVSTSTGATSCSVFAAEIQRDSTRPGTSSTTCYYDVTTAKNFSQDNNFRNMFVPRMKCIDFIRSVFSMYNLIGFYENGEIVVKPINEYYDEGKTIDLSKYVDNDDYSIGRSAIYSEINYKFNKPKTLFINTSNDQTLDEYGNESWKSTDKNGFDGGKLEVNVKFGKMIYEQFYDLGTELFFNGYWGFNVNESSAPSIEKNLIHTIDYGNSFINISGQTSKNFSLADGGSYHSFLEPVMFVPRNYIYTNDLAPTTIYYNYNFGDEVVDDYRANENTLFKNFHQSNILEIYSTRARVLSIKAHLTSNLILDLKLNDKIIINNNIHRVIEIKTNLTNGNCDLKLLRL